MNHNASTSTLHEFPPLTAAVSDAMASVAVVPPEIVANGANGKSEMGYPGSENGKEKSEVTLGNEGGSPVTGWVMDYPEGGQMAYLNVLGGFLAMFASFGFNNSFGALQAYYQENQLASTSPSDISWIGSIAQFIMFCTGLPSGFLFDAGYFQYQLALGSMLNIIGTFTLSVSKSYYQILLSYNLAVGIGAGMVFGPLVACIGTYFNRKRGIMIGMVSCGAATGAVAFPLMLNILFRKMGYASGVRTAAYLQVGCFAIANILMRPRKLPRRQRPPVLRQFWAFLHEPLTWFVCGGCCLTIVGMFVPIFYFQVFVQDHNGPQWLVDYGLSILNSTAVIARIVIGLTCDRWGKMNNAVPVSAFTALMVYVFMTATSTAGAVVFALLFGFAQGAWITAQAPAIMSLSRHVEEVGSRVGLGFLFLGCGSLVGGPVAGALLVKAGGYWAPCVFGGTATMLGAILLAFGRQGLAKRAGTWKV